MACRGSGAADAGLQLNVYTAVPGSPSDDGLKLLASWAATRATEADGAAAEGHGVQAGAPAGSPGPTGRPTTTPTERDL